MVCSVSLFYPAWACYLFFQALFKEKKQFFVYSYIFFFWPSNNYFNFLCIPPDVRFFFPGACTIICDVLARCIPRIAGVETVCIYMHTILNNNASVGGNCTLSCRLIECTRIQISVSIIIVIKIQKKKIKYLYACALNK